MGKLSLVKQLLHKGAEPNVQPNWFRPPLDQASKKGHYDVVRLLLESGADMTAGERHPYSTPAEGHGALGRACRFGHIDIV